MKITVVQGDITTQEVDAITNAANPQLRGGGGVCGAIFEAAGWDDLQDECWSDNHPITMGSSQDGQNVRVPTGRATFTNSYGIGCMFIIHAVGPVYAAYPPAEAEALLRSAYEQALQVAKAHGAKTIALPALSAGVYGYPVDEVARVAIEVATSKWGAAFDEVRFVLFPDDAKAAFDAALARHAPTQ